MTGLESKLYSAAMRGHELACSLHLKRLPDGRHFKTKCTECGAVFQSVDVEGERVLRGKHNPDCVFRVIDDVLEAHRANCAPDHRDRSEA